MYVNASIKHSPDEVIVVPVNLRGVPYLKVFGKDPMVELPRGKLLDEGVPRFVTREAGGTLIRYYVLIPSKRHWRDASSRTSVTSAFINLADILKAAEIRTVSIPLLGVALFNGERTDTELCLAPLINLSTIGTIFLTLSRPYE